jgi:kynurenine formamidase
MGGWDEQAADRAEFDARVEFSNGGHLEVSGFRVVEHLTGLGQLPPHGARFTAAPPRFARLGTFPVRAFAVTP